MKFLGPTSSGSQADQVFSHNRYGQYVRRRATPTKPETTYQTLVRANLADASAAWRNLTSAQRNGWDSWAASHPTTDALGQTLILTGHAYFVGQQAILLRTLQPMILEPPVADPVWTSTSVGLTCNAGTTTMPFTFSGIGIGQGILLEMGPPVSAGVAFNGRWKYITAVFASSTSPIDLWSEYTANRWGIVASGQKIWWRTAKVAWGVAKLPWTTLPLTAA